MSTLARNVKFLRERKGMTRQDLAVVADIARSTVDDMEEGRTRNFQRKTLNRVSVALGVGPEMLSTPMLAEQYEFMDIEIYVHDRLYHITMWSDDKKVILDREPISELGKQGWSVASADYSRPRRHTADGDTYYWGLMQRKIQTVGG